MQCSLPGKFHHVCTRMPYLFPLFLSMQPVRSFPKAQHHHQQQLQATAVVTNDQLSRYVFYMCICMCAYRIDVNAHNKFSLSLSLSLSLSPHQELLLLAHIEAILIFRTQFYMKVDVLLCFKINPKICLRCSTNNTMQFPTHIHVAAQDT